MFNECKCTLIRAGSFFLRHHVEVHLDLTRLCTAQTAEMEGNWGRALVKPACLALHFPSFSSQIKLSRGPLSSILPMPLPVSLSPAELSRLEGDSQHQHWKHRHYKKHFLGKIQSKIIINEQIFVFAITVIEFDFANFWIWKDLRLFQVVIDSRR